MEGSGRDQIMRRHLIMYLVGLKETTETAVRISGLRAEI
jgi:hypothetical protein